MVIHSYHRPENCPASQRRHITISFKLLAHGGDQPPFRPHWQGFCNTDSEQIYFIGFQLVE